MQFNFALALVCVVAISGLIYALDVFWLARRRKKAVQCYEKSGSDQSVIDKLTKPSALVDTARSIFPVLLLVLVVRSFLFEPFQIPSGSMIPTLTIGDFILVNKFDYGLRLPVLHTNVIPIGKPKPGDVLVFKAPQTVGKGADYIKRVIGVPGDHIRYENKHLMINGKPVPTKMIRHDDEGGYTLYQQTVGQHNFTMQLNDTVPMGQGDGEWTVPEGYYFVMGDNRDNSFDSRFWGFVADNRIVGRAVYIWMHWPNWGKIPNFSTNGVLH